MTGHWKIVRQRQPISAVIAHPETPTPLREKLNLILELREFARTELHLPVEGQYLDYVHLDRPYAVWNVHATPEFSLAPKTWFYPVVGRLKYRGYFSEKAARKHGEKLRAQGYDVYVHGVEAYSTLGWFKDPVLSTFIHHDANELAEILFHELAHQRLFVRGDTDFDEAFATAVAEEGMRRYLLIQGPAAYEVYEASRARRLQFVALILQTREALRTLYGDPPAEQLLARTSSSVEDTCASNNPDNLRSPAELRAAKHAILEKLPEQYEKLKQEWGGFVAYGHWFTKRLNNAQLNTVATYYQLVPAFHILLREHDHDLDRFYKIANALAELPKEERHRRLQALLSPKTSESPDPVSNPRL
jgi:predicted aminopeptidase